jgi:Carboxypeptidase regulatory-like domain
VPRPSGLLAIGAIVTLVCQPCAAGQGSTVTEAPRTPPGTGLVVGQVLDGATGRPVPEAMVDLLPMVAPTSPTSTQGVPRVRVISDSSGRFFFPDLPAGVYNFRAGKPGYVDARGLQRTPGSLATPITLADGQKILDVKMSLWRFGTIAGTVVDENGEPMVGVEVRALGRSFVGGRPRFTIVPPTGTATDDRGAFRMPLPPGEYAIVVPILLTTFPMSVMQAGFSPELMSAAREPSVLGSPTNQQIGNAVLSTGNRVPVPPAPTGERLTSVYLSTFYPSSTGVGPTAALSLASGEERTANLQLRLTPAVTVSGTIRGPDGPLQKTAVRLVLAALGESASEADLDTATGLTDAGGAFTLLGVPPGQYLLKVLSPRPAGGAPTPPSTPQQPGLWATEPVSVGHADISGLAIQARPTLTISGRFEFRGAADPPPARLIAGLYANLDSTSGGPGAVTTFDANAAFVTEVPGGTYTLRVETPEGWHLKSIELGGKDATDRPIELTDDAALMFVLTDQRTGLSGVVRDERGVPDAYGLVAIFPTNRERWTGYGVTGWRVSRAAVSSTGVYSFSNIPAGEYFVTSVPDALTDTWQDPKTLDLLSRSAVRVVIADGEKRTQDLKKAAAR